MIEVERQLLPLTKILDVEDFKDFEFDDRLRDVSGLHLHGEEYLQMMDKKLWEYAMGMYALERSGIGKDATALGIGCGVEPPIFYMANRLRFVIATDLYNMNTPWGVVSRMLTNPWEYAPYGYDRQRLAVMNANGTNLPFPEEFFDFVFSYSSIEHFGGKDKAAQCLQEVRRVLKPGGVASITTELCVWGELFLPRLREKYAAKRLHRYGILKDMFTMQELDTLVEASGLELSNPLAPSKAPPDAETWTWPGKHGQPYLYMRPGFAPDVVWTSVHLLLKKR